MPRYKLVAFAARISAHRLCSKVPFFVWIPSQVTYTFHIFHIMRPFVHSKMKYCFFWSNILTWAICTLPTYPGNHFTYLTDLFLVRNPMWKELRDWQSKVLTNVKVKILKIIAWNCATRWLKLTNVIFDFGCVHLVIALSQDSFIRHLIRHLVRHLHILS